MPLEPFIGVSAKVKYAAALSGGAWAAYFLSCAMKARAAGPGGPSLR